MFWGKEWPKFPFVCVKGKSSLENLKSCIKIYNLLSLWDGLCILNILGKTCETEQKFLITPELRGVFPWNVPTVTKISLELFWHI